MAQTLFLPPQTFYASTPSSPDPTPLRLLAFSVAEAALQTDPNSPFLASDGRMAFEADWSAPWTQAKPRLTRQPSSGDRLWDVVESAKERRVRTTTMAEIETPPSPPISPAAYTFTLPPHSPLAESVATLEQRQPARSTSRARLEARLNLASLGKARPFPLFTRSAEPSPVKTTFSGLDQSRPPPEFIPRPAAQDAPASPSERLRRQATMPPVPAPSRHTARLPSLAQIQAKMNKAGHRRGSSIGSSRDLAKETFALTTVNRLKSIRTLSEDSVEVLKTPTDEFPPVRPQIVTGSPERRPATPPSPVGSVKESRLAPFLRERTSGRLRTRPVSMPPMNGVDINVFALAGTKETPKVTVTPPKSKTSAAVPPPSPSRAIVLNTPPNRHSSRMLQSSPSSPTESIRSNCTASPTLSVPMITCTPAPSRSVRDGVELDSDEEEGDVVLFEGESGDEEGSERERRGKEMLDRLNVRRRSR